jgi:hypothetical protein
MKHASFSIEKRYGYDDFSLGGFVRAALVVTLSTSIVVLPALVCSCDPELWVEVGPPFAVSIALTWTSALALGWFFRLMVRIWTILWLGEPQLPSKLDQNGKLWDRWMDGPEPLPRSM